MKFTFATTTTVDIDTWIESNRKLEQDLLTLASGNACEEEVKTYLDDMIQELKPVNNEKCTGMLFLMHDDPASMPADARVDFVYRPTYLAATFMMTAMNRFESIAQNNSYRKATAAVLGATLGRDFKGAGYDSEEGFMETLRIFASGDTLAFIEKYPMLNARFAAEFKKVLAFLENEFCTGNVKNAWSGNDYSEQAKMILDMYKNTSDKTEYVWYACYGSNINRTRFMRYINGCRDTTPPVEDRPFTFPHNIYFAKSSKQWDCCGVAFLDDSKQGSAYGRIYKITREQYEQVKEQEGPSYRKPLVFGEIEGMPVYSFTDTQKNEPVRTPSDGYFMTILEGLQDCYSGIYSDEALFLYLSDTVFPANVFRVARAIKRSEHYLSNAQICEQTDLDLHTVTAATEWLVEHEVIQQDQRSIRAGHAINDAQAFFFTTDRHNGRLLIAEMDKFMNRIEEIAADESVSGEVEGHRHLLLSSRIERSSRNRLEAIKLHGYKCQACGFDFARTYGELGHNYIEVHHLNPLAEQDGEQIVNPETDLVCLCANCHRMVHRNRDQVLTLAELKEILNR